MEEESPASSYEYAPQETNPPSNVGHPPPSNPSYQTNLTLTYTPPSNVADSSSHAAYPPPIDAAKYPPPPISVSSLHASQQLPGYAGNPGPVPEKFPSEKYPPAFQQHASMSTMDSVGYPVQRSRPLAPGGVVAQETSRWSTGLFDCMDDPGNGNNSPPFRKASFLRLYMRELTSLSGLWKTPDSRHDFLGAMRHLRTNRGDHRRRPFVYVEKCQPHRFLPSR